MSGPDQSALLRGLFVVFLLLGAWPATARSSGLNTPARGGAVEIGVEPPQMVLGEQSFARVDIRLPAGVTWYEVRAIRGAIDSHRRRGDVVTASYHPPKDYIPAVDVIAVRAMKGEKKIYGYVALPLHGQGRADIRTRPFAQATLRIGERVFGPVRADSKGNARIPVVVPPGVTEGFDDNENIIDLGVPQVERVALFAFQDEVQSDERLEIFFVVLSPDGTSTPRAALDIQSEGGQISEMRALDDSARVAEVTPSPEASVLVIKAEVAGAGDVPFELALPVSAPPQPPAAPSKEDKAPSDEPVKKTPEKSAAPPEPPEEIVSWGVSAAALLGAGTNFGTVNGFQGGLFVSGDLTFRGHTAFIGGLGSALYGRADSTVDKYAQGSLGSSEDLIVQLLGTVGYRTRFWRSLGLELCGYLGPVLSRHAMDAEIVKDTASESFHIEDRTGGWSVAAGGGGRVTWALPVGFVFFGGRYLWVGASSDDAGHHNLSLMLVDAGWGVDFGF